MFPKIVLFQGKLNDQGIFAKSIDITGGCSYNRRTMIKFLPLDILCVSHRIPRKNQNAMYRLQISALVPEISKFVKCAKYANEMTDYVMHSTQYYLKYINGAILANLQHRSLKLDRLIVL